MNYKVTLNTNAEISKLFFKIQIANILGLLVVFDILFAVQQQLNTAKGNI